MTEDRTDRAEEAFRAAFAEQADDLSVTGADTTAWAEAARCTTRRRRLPVAVAAAVVAVLGGTLLVVDVLAEPGGPAPAEAPVVETERVDGAIAPRDGWRWVERGGVAVQVPEGWAQESLMCGGAWTGGAPAVASVGADDYATLADCMGRPGRDSLGTDAVTEEAFPPVAVSLWRTILIIEDAGTVYDGDRQDAVEVPDGTYTYEGWTLDRTTYGGTRVTLLSDEEHEELATEVLASVVVDDLSPSGCRAIEEFGQERHPASETDTVARAATVCGYGAFPRKSGDEPVHGLEASRRLDAGAAAGLTAALRSAPLLPEDPALCEYRLDVPYVQLVRLFGDDDVRELEVAVYDCAVQFDGTWRTLTDEVASFLVRPDPV
ncbi:hypothetical protein [Nocardioides alkalitolerans]|uniref:hypothetical protein n=1 Tax=Nocardioides alkalitolerans TaxID=281714 RepID=UPI0004048D20|nr:hypothetical protein [Nocardioides alkalitolerans]